MKKLFIVLLALIALLGWMVPLSAVETETFTGTVARSGTYKRPFVAGERQSFVHEVHNIVFTRQLRLEA